MKIENTLIRAAEYIRMSTDKQVYSIDNQRSFLADYSKSNGIEIVKTYIDGGKSGLNIKGRDALQMLLADVLSGDAEFDIVLVYDVSRWGRFQDTDESAHYEFICKRAGKKIIYAAEQFSNDGSPMSTIVKNIKRVMAGEYSRELSTKVFHAIARRASEGYFSGGPANYGLRRVMIDSAGNIKSIAEFGEWKAYKTDSVKLTLGPPEEVAEVKEIFRKFVYLRWNYHKIANDLHSRNVKLPPTVKRWNSNLIRGMLLNEKYTGCMVFYKTSTKLSTKKIDIDESEQIKCFDAFPAIIEKDVFDKAVARVKSNIRKSKKEEMLEFLISIYKKHKRISHTLIKATPNAPSPLTYKKHFGSYELAYRAAGFNPYLQDFQKEIQRLSTRRMTEAKVIELLSDLRNCGERARRWKLTGVTIRHDFVITVAVMSKVLHSPVDRIYLPSGVDLVLAICFNNMDQDTDNFLLRPNDFEKKSIFRKESESKDYLNPWRCEKSLIADRIIELANEKRFRVNLSDTRF